MVKKEYDEKIKNKTLKKDRNGDPEKNKEENETKAKERKAKDEAAKAEQDRDEKVGAANGLRHFEHR